MSNRVVIKGEVARHLLRKGYQIIDVKPNREVPLATVFVFASAEGLDKAIAEMTEK